MPPISADDLRQLVFARRYDEIVGNHLFASETFFLPDANERDSFLGHVAGKLSVQATNITVVGSAKMGYTLDPAAFPRAFHSGSDIDIVVVCPTTFGAMWQSLLRWHYQHRNGLGRDDSQWAEERVSNVYWGWFAPAQIRYRLLHAAHLEPMKQLSFRWFNVLKEASRLPQARGLSVEARLYQSWDHARRYHVNGLEAMRVRLSGR